MGGEAKGSLEVHPRPDGCARFPQAGGTRAFPMFYNGCCRCSPA